MAFPFDQAQSTANALLEAGAEDNVYGGMPLLVHLQEREQIIYDGGETIKGDMWYQKIGASGSFTGDDLLNVSQTDTDRAWKADWKFYYANAVLDIPAILRNSGKHGIVNLMQSKVKNAQMKIRDDIATDIFSTNGDSATGVTGLRNLGSTTTTHHSITVSDFSGWKADVDSSNSSLALSDLEQTALDVSQGVGGDEPDIHVCSKQAFKAYWSLLQNNQRFAGVSTGKGGFRFLQFNDAPVFYDSHCPGTASTADNHWFMLNSRHLSLVVHKDANFKAEAIPAPSNQAIRVNRLMAALNLVCRNRRTVGVHTVINA